jgi:hypothetical protein
MRIKAIAAALSLAALSALAVIQTSAPQAASLAGLLPAQALLVLEAKDFSALVRDWNGSAEKELWLKSDNFQVFSRSRLLLRLGDVQDQFAATAGFDADMALVQAVAGGESALAIYDIGNLEFLYVTRMPTAKAVETVLWQKRNDYQPRNAGGKPFFVRTDTKTHRTVAFAATDDYLLLATREDLLAGALQLMGGSGNSAKAERWYDQATKAAGSPGELRLVLNMEDLLATPQFRSYWIQRNVSDLRQFRAGVVDLQRSAGEIREERVFVRTGETPAAEKSNLNEVLALVPADAGLYQVWAKPTVDQAAQALERKVLAPRQFAPTRASGSSGDETNLEERIDETPLEDVGSRFQAPALRKLLEGAKLEAVLQLESSHALPGGVFVGHHAAVILVGASDWDGAAARTAIADAVARLWTSARLGAGWTEQKDGYLTLDGLTRIAVAARGRNLIVADAPVTLAVSRGEAAVPSDAVYAAGFRHSRERANFVRMMRLLEKPPFPAGGAEEKQEREPMFFSDNLGSLSRTLGRVDSVSVVVRGGGQQTVLYKLSK